MIYNNRKKHKSVFSVRPIIKPIVDNNSAIGKLNNNENKTEFYADEIGPDEELPVLILKESFEKKMNLSSKQKKNKKRLPGVKLLLKLHKQKNNN